MGDGGPAALDKGDPNYESSRVRASLAGTCIHFNLYIVLRDSGSISGNRRWGTRRSMHSQTCPVRFLSSLADQILFFAFSRHAQNRADEYRISRGVSMPVARWRG